MLRYLAIVTTLALTCVIAIGPAAAQMQPAPTPSQPPVLVPTTGLVQGTVKKVDPAAGTLEVSKLFGSVGRTLEVTNHTQIQTQGHPAKLADIVEGMKVKASYEVRDGKNVATSIEVVP